MAKVGYRPSVVSFVDVLGFRALLNSSQEPSEIADLIRKVRGALHPLSADYSQSDPKGKTSSKAFGYSLSDAVVRIRPFDTRFRDGALFYELYDLMHAQAQLVWEGIVVRGAITVGDAYSHKSSDMAFGPAVAEAYEWETGRAVFPRIVVTDRAIDAYNTDRRLKGESELSESMRLLAQGDDGLYYIDYLRGISTEFDYYGSYYELLERHASLIRKNLLTAESGSRTHQKYMWLKIYHNTVVDEIRKNRNARADAAFFAEFEIEAKPFFKSLVVA